MPYYNSVINGPCSLFFKPPPSLTHALLATACEPPWQMMLPTIPKQSSALYAGPRKNGMGVPYSSILDFIYFFLPKRYRNQPRAFCHVSLRPPAEYFAQFHANILGYARGMTKKAAWCPKPWKSSRSCAFFFLSCCRCLFLAPSWLEEDSSSIDSRYVVIIVIRTKQ